MIEFFIGAREADLQAPVSIEAEDAGGDATAAHAAVRLQVQCGKWSHAD